MVMLAAAIIDSNPDCAYTLGVHMTNRMTRWLVVAVLVAAVKKEHKIYPRPVNRDLRCCSPFAFNGTAGW